MKLLAEVEEKASRLARKPTSGSEVKVRGDHEVADVFRVDVAGDCLVVAGWAGVLHDGSVVGCEPEEKKDSRVHGGVGSAQIVDGEEGFGDGLDFGKVER